MCVQQVSPVWNSHSCLAGAVYKQAKNRRGELLASGGNIKLRFAGTMVVSITRLPASVTATAESRMRNGEIRRPVLTSAPKAYDLAAVTLRGAALGKGFKVPQCLALLRRLLAQLPARLAFAVERLRHRGWTAHIAELQNLYFKIAAIIGHPQPVAKPKLSRGFGRLTVELNPAEFTGSRGQRARLKESCGPEPFVYSTEVIALFCYTRPPLGARVQGIEKYIGRCTLG